MPTVTGETWTFVTGVNPVWTSVTRGRPPSYDEDLAWDVVNGEWAEISELVVAGGGSMQSQIVLVGHSAIYYGSL